MLQRNPRHWLLLASAVALFGGFALLSCSGGGGSSSGSNVSYGENIQGTYSVVATTTYNNCPDTTPVAVQWILTIQQNANYSQAQVFFQEEGAGSQKSELFAGDVYGTLVVLNTVQKTPMGGNCIQLKIEDYNLNVDVSANPAVIQGTLIDNIVYVGDSCSPSTVSCQTERRIASPGTDDDDDASPTADDDASNT